MIATDLQLHCEDGRNIIELKSAVTTKAQALRELIDEVEPQILIMCGDDLGDVPALDVVAGWINAGHPGARVVSFSGKQLTRKAVTENLNVLDYDTYFRTTDLILEHNIPELLLLFNKTLALGFDGHH